MFKHRHLSLSLIIVFLLTLSACVAVPPASLPAQPPAASQAADEEAGLEMKVAGSSTNRPQSAVIPVDPESAVFPASAMQVAELPALESSSWQGDLR